MPLLFDMFFYHYKVAESHLNKYSVELYKHYTAGECSLVASLGGSIRIFKYINTKEKLHTYFALDVKYCPTTLTSDQKKLLRSLRMHNTRVGLSKKHLTQLIELEEKSRAEKLQRTICPGVLGFCVLEKIPRWVALETAMLYVNPNARGAGIATSLYDAIMKDGVIVISGYSHNKKSRRLWMKLVQNPKYVTWAHDIIDLSRYAAISVSKNNFECDLKLYEDIKKIRRRRKQDIRIIAFNPRYVSC